MSLFGILLLSAASVGSIGFGIHRQIKFTNFKKYGEDGEYKMISGIVSTDTNLNSTNDTIKQFNIVNNTYSLESDNSVLKQVTVKRGEKKSRVLYQSIYDNKGRYVCSVPYTEEYTDWTTFFDNKWFIPDIKVGTHKINLDNIKIADEPNTLRVTGHYAHKIFKSIGIDDTHFRNSNEYEFGVKSIRNGETVSVIGRHETRYIPMYIGSRDNVLSKISGRRYTRLPFILAGLFGLTFSAFLLDDYYDHN